MSVVLNATPNDVAANSYATVAEAQTYFDTRTAVAGWDNAAAQDVLLMMATRVIDAALTARRQFVPPVANRAGYYIVRPTWTGLRSTLNLSKLAWCRAGMYDRNGVALAETAFPQELIDAVSELAGALGANDLTADNDVAVQGITDIKAGPVSISFAAGVAAYSKALPESVLDLLVPAWLTDQVIQGMFQASLEVVST